MKLSENPYKTSIIIALVLFGPLLLMIIGGIVSRHQAGIALNEAEQEIFIEWFVFNEVTVYQQVRIWEESGLVGLGIVSEDELLERILEFYEGPPPYPHRLFAGSTEDVQADIMAVLTGGFPFLDESGFSAQRFETAISRINGMLDVNIQTEWYDLLGGN